VVFSLLDKGKRDIPGCFTCRPEEKEEKGKRRTLGRRLPLLLPKEESRCSAASVGERKKKGRRPPAIPVEVVVPEGKGKDVPWPLSGGGRRRESLTLSLWPDRKRKGKGG